MPTYNERWREKKIHEWLALTHAFCLSHFPDDFAPGRDGMGVRGTSGHAATKARNLAAFRVKATKLAAEHFYSPNQDINQALPSLCCFLDAAIAPWAFNATIGLLQE